MSWSPCSLATGALIGNLLAVRWLLLRAFTAGGMGLIPDEETSRGKKSYAYITIPGKETQTHIYFLPPHPLFLSSLLLPHLSSLPVSLPSFLSLFLFSPLNQVILQEEKAQVSILLSLVACSAFCFPNQV